MLGHAGRADASPSRGAATSSTAPATSSTCPVTPRSRSPPRPAGASRSRRPAASGRCPSATSPPTPYRWSCAGPARLRVRSTISAPPTPSTPTPSSPARCSPRAATGRRTHRTSTTRRATPSPSSRRSTTSRSPTARRAASQPGMAYQRVYGHPGKEIDVLEEVRTGDVVLIPHGWHGPSMAVPGYDLYYLNVMAGPGDERAWRICDDPAHTWVRGTWDDQEVDPRLPFRRPPTTQSGPAGRPAGGAPMSTTRLTVAQAIVRFLEAQHVERDGVETPFFAGCWGIFGHGNVAGVGQALLEREVAVREGTAGDADARAALPPGPQRAGHGARLGRLRPSPRPARRLRLHGVRRPRRDQHGHRRRPGHHQPPARAAAARRRLRHPGVQPGAAGAGGPDLPRRQRQRLLQAGLEVLGPGQPARAAAAVAAGRDAGAHRPGRDRRGDAVAAPGRAGRGVGLRGRPLRPPGVARRPPAGRGRRPGPRRRGDPLGAAPPAGRRRGRHLLRRHRGAAHLRRGHRRPGRGVPGRQGLAALRPPAVRRRDRRHRHHAPPTPWPPRRTSSSASAPATATSPPPPRPSSPTRACAS